MTALFPHCAATQSLLSEGQHHRPAVPPRPRPPRSPSTMRRRGKAVRVRVCPHSSKLPVHRTSMRTRAQHNPPPRSLPGIRSEVGPQKLRVVGQ
jgi:hypothetical protein